MCLLPPDEHLVSHALELAEQAAGFASPNPSVGCVIARDGIVLGEGAHYYDARDHAEIAALKAAATAGHDVRGAAAYVTLEPCAHHGRTGPCADALIAAGIARAVVATLDPNPRVRGEGLARMGAAGIATCLLEASHHLAQRARRLNDAFAFSIQHNRPFVSLKAAISADGMIAPAVRSTTAPYWITGPAARADVQRLRHASDAILTGIGTVLADDPTLTDRTGLLRRRPLLRVILDSNLRIPLASALVAGACSDVLIFASLSADPARAAALRDRGAEVIMLPARGGGVDPGAVLATLHERGVRNVLLESGSALNAAFLNAGLVDKVVVYRASVELGVDGIPFAAGISVEALLAQPRSVEKSAFPRGDRQDISVTGYLHDPWDGI